MDPAVIGHCRIGYFRIGVKDTVFDDAVDALEKTPLRSMGGKTPCIQGAAKQGKTRHNVKIPIFDEVVEILEKAT